MVDASNDSGILTALGQRFIEQRLPKLERLKEQLNLGKVLTDDDLTFLKQILDDVHTNKALIEKHPEFQETSARIMHLYKEIIGMALDNEKSNQP